MKKKLQIIKIGGNIIDDDNALFEFLNLFSTISTDKILIHGGGKIATQIGNKLGIVQKMVDGRRITDAETLEVVTMVYAGLINKKIVALLQSLQTNAIGLSGADGNVILSKKRINNHIDYGFVGDIEKVENHFIQLLLEQEISPIFCAITHDKKGQLLNTNADTITAEIAIAMSDNYDVEVIYVFEKNGLLSNIDDENSVIKNIKIADIQLLKTKKIIAGGMLPKVDNIELLIKKGIKKVVLCKAEYIQNTTGQYFIGTIFEK